jgi:hypothetical protein
LLGKSPGFIAVAMLTLALGVGITTVIFSVINSVLLQFLPFYNAGSLVKITFEDTGLGLHDMRFSVPELEDLRSEAPRRFSAELVGAFAVLALLLASVGIYGVPRVFVWPAFAGDRRTNRIRGRRWGQYRLILAAVTAPMIATVLYGIQIIDPLVFLVVPTILLLVSFAASYIPSRRAAR